MLQQKQQLSELELLLEDCLIKDQLKLKKHIASLKKRLKNKLAIDHSLVKIDKNIQSSLQQVSQKKQKIKNIAFPENLPIVQELEQIQKLIEQHQVIIVAGETGSGKTTQLPKLCLAMGRGMKGLIGHTQPRRIAARTVASRIAEELKLKLGEQVGYKIRFDDKSSQQANIRVMTDGMLLAEMSADPLLSDYDTLIIDEAHERSLNIDFILGYLHQLLKKRKDIKVIITSATIDPQSFSRHFNQAPVVEVSGRTYPVEVRYRPLIELSSDDENAEVNTENHREPLVALADAIDELILEGAGDILAFFPGEREIRDAAQFLRKKYQHKLNVLPLYSRLSRSEQDKVFKLAQGRRIVLATNVAETSLTVPGIRYVIDTGVARISRYNQRTKVQQLPVEAISQASANQRKGRCGRLEDGICIRLYAEEDFLTRPEFTDAEIHRTHLASVILKMLDLKLSDIENFPFFERPDPKRIRDGLNLLEMMGAIKKAKGDRQLTLTGKRLAQLPIDPRLAKIIITAAQFNCVKEALIICSGLSVQDVRERPLEYRQKANEIHQQYNELPSDFCSLLNLWSHFHHLKSELSNSQYRKKLSLSFLSFLRIRDWIEVYAQLKKIAVEMNIHTKDQPADYADIHKALIAGLPDQLGLKTTEGDYQGARNSRFLVNKQSAIFSRKKQTAQNKKLQTGSTKWIVATELVETQSVYARYAAHIDPEWCLEVVPELVKTRYFEPFWSERSGCAKVYMQQTLFGLMLVSKKTVNFQQIDEVVSRQLFIQQGIYGRKIKTRIPEIKAFWNAIDEITAQENKIRKRDRLKADSEIYQILDQHIPATILSAKMLEKWYRNASTKERQLLNIPLEALLQSDSKELPQLPESIEVKQYRLPLSYHFSPGEDDDGISVSIPASLIDLFQDADFEYLIPNFLEEKIAALLKSLPKRLRKNFVPVPDYARVLVERINPEKERLIPAIINHLKAMTGYQLEIDDFNKNSIPQYLNMNFNVIDDNFNILAKGRDLLKLQQGAKTSQWKKSEKIAESSPQQSKMEVFSFWPEKDLDKQVEVIEAGIRVIKYPALYQKENKIILAHFNTGNEADYYQKEAIIALLLLNIPEQINFARKQLLNKDRLSLLYSNIGSADSLLNDLSVLVVRQIVSENMIQNKDDFEKNLLIIQSEFYDVFATVAAELVEILKQYVDISKKIKRDISPMALASYQHIATQLDDMFYEHFLRYLHSEQLRCYKRYLQSMQLRLAKLPHSADKERAAIEVLNHWSEKIKQMGEKLQPWQADYSEWLHLKTMINELSISLFTQELGTLWPVSEKRLKKAFEKVNAYA